MLPLGSALEQLPSGLYFEVSRSAVDVLGSDFRSNKKGDNQMSLYRVIRLIGSSPNSWEEAAKAALEEAAKHLEDLRVAEVEQLDVRMQENKVVEYRARVRASFRYHPEKR